MQGQSYKRYYSLIIFSSTADLKLHMWCRLDIDNIICLSLWRSFECAIFTLLEREYGRYTDATLFLMNLLMQFHPSFYDCSLIYKCINAKCITVNNSKLKKLQIFK